MFSDLWNAIIREGWNGPLSFPSHLGTFGHDSRPLIGWWPSFPAIGWTITVLLCYRWKTFFFTLWLVGQQPSHNTFKKEQFVRFRQQKTMLSASIWVFVVCTTFKDFIESTVLRDWVYFYLMWPIHGHTTHVVFLTLYLDVETVRGYLCNRFKYIPPVRCR
jgi:hypothetical protein